jgi:Tfp pilus assembly protein PilV
VARGLIQYQYVLMQQNRKSFATIPDNVKTPCYLANNYLYQSAELKVGFPVQVLDYQGHEKQLLDFAEITKSSTIFNRPEGYQVYFPTF